MNFIGFESFDMHVTYMHCICQFFFVDYLEISTPESPGLLVIPNKYSGQCFGTKLVQSFFIFFSDWLICDLRAKRDNGAFEIASKPFAPSGMARFEEIDDVAKEAETHHGVSPPDFDKA